MTPRKRRPEGTMPQAGPIPSPHPPGDSTVAGKARGRVDSVPEANGGKALAVYLMAGPETPELAEAAVEGGADLIELGFPFSDPLADGPGDPPRRRAGARAGNADARLPGLPGRGARARRTCRSCR